MLIYAVFMCLATTGTCSPMSGNIGPVRTYQSLKDCQMEARMFSHSGPDKHGRFFVTTWDESGKSHASTQQWFECRSRHVETWNSAQ
jgi:hypothetical protein